MNELHVRHCPVIFYKEDRFSPLTVLFLLSSHENKQSPWNMWGQDFDRNTESVGSYSTRQIEQTGSSSEHDTDVSVDVVPNGFFEASALVVAWLHFIEHFFLSHVDPDSTSSVFAEPPRSSSTAFRRSSRVMIRMRCGASLSALESPNRCCICLW